MALMYDILGRAALVEAIIVVMVRSVATVSPTRAVVAERSIQKEIQEIITIMDAGT